MFLTIPGLIKYQAGEQKRQLKGIPKNSVGLEEGRSEEVYSGEVSMLKEQIHDSNKLNLIFRYDPLSIWEQQNNLTIWKGNKDRVCIKCMFYFVFLLLFYHS